jgi:hypothetical protein
MDLFHEVEAFRSMLQSNGVVSPDGSEESLEHLLCSDASAIVYFTVNYLSESKNPEDVAMRSRYSCLERRHMFSKDLVILSLWATYLNSIAQVGDQGYLSAQKPIRDLGFAAFHRLDYQEMRNMVATARSKANDLFWSLRVAVDVSSKLAKDPGYLLRSRKSH